ncbi:MAG: helix-turn-helix domain-containing protein [Candidatus Levybacteria bacterium]|nr:helix-turn-helix domain-containing protein [Candidatus Levybacteria bacterium]
MVYIVRWDNMNYTIETNLLNVKEVSSILKLSVLTVYRYISEKKLKAIQFGGRYLIKKSSLDQFVKERKTKSS